MREALASAKPTLGREATEGRAESPVEPVWEMVAGLGVATNGSSEWACGRRMTGRQPACLWQRPAEMSTHQRAYAHYDSEKLSDASARSGVKDCHSANGTLSGQMTRGRRRTSDLTMEAAQYGGAV